MPVAAKPPPRVGLPTQLAAIQDRYRRAMREAFERPRAEQGDHIRAALATLLAERAALGMNDDEAATDTPD